MRPETIQKELRVSAREAERILDNYRTKYPRTFEFIEQLSYEEERRTPLIGRTIKFSKFKDYTKFN